MDHRAWDERYAGDQLVWTAEPNQFLVAEVEGLTPGRALDFACGEGRNGVWLAEQRWTVTDALVRAVRPRRPDCAQPSAGTRRASSGVSRSATCRRPSAMNHTAAPTQMAAENMRLNRIPKTRVALSMRSDSNQVRPSV